MLSSFSVENYRAFSRRQDIELRPLTLFFGWNSGGKSALVRFLPLIAESILAAGPPIWLAGDVGRQATWPELVCKTTERGSLRFALSWSDADTPDTDTLNAEWEVAGDLEGRWQETKSLSVKLGPLQRSFNDENLAGVRATTGLVPWNGDDEESTTVLKTLEARLRIVASQIQWVSGVRVRPPRVATYGGGAPSTLRSDGGDAVAHLIAAQLRSTADPLLEATGSFFSALGEQLVLDNPIGGVWRVLLRPIGAPKVDVSLCDTGEGYAQVLPVLVALARARIGEGPRLLCLEQPELHLHTRAQAELAKLLVESAKHPSQPRLLVETHSEVLLTSIQLAIASGVIEPEMVRVYWVESRADGTSDALPVDFDVQGRPVNTSLIGAFGEAVQLGQELIMKQLEKQRPAS